MKPILCLFLLFLAGCSSTMPAPVPQEPLKTPPTTTETKKKADRPLIQAAPPRKMGRSDLKIQIGPKKTVINGLIMLKMKDKDESR